MVVNEGALVYGRDLILALVNVTELKVIDEKSTISELTVELVSPDEQAIVNTFLKLKNGGTVDFISMSDALFAWTKQLISENS